MDNIGRDVWIGDGWRIDGGICEMVNDGWRYNIGRDVWIGDGWDRYKEEYEDW